MVVLICDSGGGCALEDVLRKLAVVGNKVLRTVDFDRSDSKEQYSAVSPETFESLYKSIYTKDIDMPKHNDGLEGYDYNLFSRPEKELKTLDLKLAIVEKEKLLKSIQCDAKDRRVEILTGRNRIDTWAHNLLADE
ncbi:hypothetical protein PPACK8108_LOCUS9190 [Phakopsora pachyrhizi]|uniref:Uncharacterized protein n=1 Tax=Phakopsora pachyrhizi TaxID=170000 RepID=A0AAV0AXY2_PHAPC|nr:hypothetical protein PPACK8108_LOCUS9190 [Phakopsora pachyrhizi]